MRPSHMNGPHVYHQIPKGLVGTNLYPLNRLKTIVPDAYEAAMAKYNDHPERRNLPMTPIPPLLCMWGDVVQCSPVHPHLLFQAQRDAHVDPRPQTFFAIPRDRVSHLQAVVFVRGVDGSPDYERVDWSMYVETTQVPSASQEWYRQLAARGKRGAVFHGIPHVMVRGEIDVAGCSIIDWVDPI